MTTEPEALEATALWLTAPRTLEFRRELVPPPGPGAVRVRAIASAISHGTELLVYHGEAPVDLALDLPTLAGSFGFPLKYGYASVGHVVDVGADVAGITAGDLVFALHPHQSVFVVPAAMAIPLPDGLDPLLGVFTANLETAVNVLLDTPLRLGEVVTVFGQGTVGLLITQLLRRAGCGRVVVVDPLPQRRDLARRLGADAALAPEENVVHQVRALTRGRGADTAIEVSGNPRALQSALDVVADEGTVVAVSWYGTKPVPLALGGHFHRGRVRIRSSQVGRLDPALAPRWDAARRQELVAEMLPRLRLAELITHRLPFREAPAAFRLIAEHPESTVQVVLVHENGEG